MRRHSTHGSSEFSIRWDRDLSKARDTRSFKEGNEVAVLCEHLAIEAYIEKAGWRIFRDWGTFRSLYEGRRLYLSVRQGRGDSKSSLVR